MRILGVFCVDIQQKNYRHNTELNFLSFFNRSSVEELLCEFALTASESLEHNPERKIFEHEDMLLCCCRIDQCVTLIVTDKEYPTRASFKLLQRMHDDPSEEHLVTILSQCQDPYSVDAIRQLQHELQETLVIMHENVDKILKCGDQIDELVEKSARLSSQSKAFYKAARRHNRCCGIQ